MPIAKPPNADDLASARVAVPSNGRWLRDDAPPVLDTFYRLFRAAQRYQCYLESRNQRRQH